MSQGSGYQRAVRERRRNPNSGNEIVQADGEMMDAETDELWSGNMYTISFRSPEA